MESSLKYNTEGLKDTIDSSATGSVCERDSGMGAKKSNYKIKPEDVLQKFKEFAGEVVKRDGKDGKDKIRAHPPPRPLKRYFIECQRELGAYLEETSVVEVSRGKLKEQSLGRPIYKRPNRRSRNSVYEASVVEEHWVVTIEESLSQAATDIGTEIRAETRGTPAKGCVAQLTRVTRAH
jgi:hypothetical protein